VALAAPAWLTPLIELTGAVDEVLPTGGLPTDGPAADGLRPPAWRIPPPEVAINLHGRGPQSHRLLLETGPERLWAFACPAAGHTSGPIWAEEEHEVRRWCRMLAHYGPAADPADLSLAVPAAAVARGVTIVHPGAKSPARRWPVDRFAAVARRLAAAGHRVLVTGSSAEQPLAVRVAALAGLPGDAVLAGRTGLGDLAALVAHARLLVSGDTGIAHLATAYRTPSVVLFGPMSPARWGPPARPYHRAIWHGTKAEPGDAPGPAVHPALLRIGVDEVLAAASDVEQAGHAVAAQ
jgi:hypothetical protein